MWHVGSSELPSGLPGAIETRVHCPDRNCGWGSRRVGALAWASKRIRYKIGAHRWLTEGSARTHGDTDRVTANSEKT